MHFGTAQMYLEDHDEQKIKYEDGSYNYFIVTYVYPILVQVQVTRATFFANGLVIDG